MTRSHAILLLTILALFALAGLLRLNDLSLYTDSTRYVIWAESLSRGAGWLDDTQPVPEAYVVNAPLYPVFLVPSQWIAGGSLHAAKVLTWLFGIGALALMFLWLKAWLPTSRSLVLCGLFAATPLTVVMFTEALSEAPFFLLLFFTLWMRERATHAPWSRMESALVVAALGLLPLVREISIAFVGAILVDALMRRQYRFATAAFVTVIATVGLWTLRNMVWVGVPESSQSTNVQFIFEHFVTPASAPLWQEWAERMIINIRSYQYELSGMMLMPFPLNLIREPSGAFVALVNLLNTVKGWIGFAFFPLLAVGLWTDVRQSSTGILRALFLAFYATIILLYPLQDIRFFLPALPFVLILLAQGLGSVLQLLPRGRQFVFTVFAATLAVVNLASIGELLRSNQRYLTAVDDHRSGRLAFAATGYYATPWELAGEALCASTNQEAVVASASKEIVPFVGGRKVLEVNRAVPLPMFEAMLREHDVSVLVVQQVRSGIRSHEIQIMESRRFRYDTISTTGWLTVLRVRNLAREGLSAATLHSEPPEPVAKLLHEARAAILRLRYREADSLLNVGRGMDPVNAELAYQRVTAASLSGSLQAAVQAQQLLFSTPRSTSYTPPGRVLLTIAQAVDAARGLQGTPRAQAYFQAGRAAWDLGYALQAKAFTDSALAADRDHFEALLWGTNYSYQTGDTASARRHLRALIRLEPENPVVTGFREIDSLSSVESKAATARRRSELYLHISRAYERIGLPEEALDLADRAWYSMPDDARERTAEILEATGRSAGAMRYREGK